MKKITALICAVLLLLSLAACGQSEAKEKVYVVGICQLVKHEALDAATEGFKAALTEKLGDKVRFVEQVGAGDGATCSVICSHFVADEVDLILANATPALLAARSATNSIPILGTSVTDYASALEIDDWSGATGVNISGTSDRVPEAEQAKILQELFPEAKTVGILYCSGEPNSKVQADVIRPELEAMGCTVSEFTFADSNDVAQVTANACDSCELLYIPTDNVAASSAELIGSVALNAGTPILCGEEGLCKGCGVATLSISYYDLGWVTGEMAAEILTGGAEVSTMEIRYAPFKKMFNADMCQALGVTAPEGFTAIG